MVLEISTFHDRSHTLTSREKTPGDWKILSDLATTSVEAGKEKKNTQELTRENKFPAIRGGRGRSRNDTAVVGESNLCAILARCRIVRDSHDLNRRRSCESSLLARSHEIKNFRQRRGVDRSIFVDMDVVDGTFELSVPSRKVSLSRLSDVSASAGS